MGTNSNQTNRKFYLTPSSIGMSVDKAGADSAGGSSGSRWGQRKNSATELTTEYYQRTLEKHRLEADKNDCDVGRINAQLNDIFIRRLQDVDCNAEGDVDLKLATYQDWVDMLLNINEVILNNLDGLETEVTERLEVVHRRVNVNAHQSKQSNESTELEKARKDICTLLKIIQNAYNDDNWDMQGVKFETLTTTQVLGGNEQTRLEDERAGTAQLAVDAHDTTVQKNKLICSMRALAVEVAAKHDEIGELKRQVLCMEEEIQKAQQKIQLKDDVIRELRNDLKCANSKISDERQLVCLQSELALKEQVIQELRCNLQCVNAKLSAAAYTSMPPINTETQRTSRSATTQVSDALECNQCNQQFTGCGCSQYDALSNHECVENQKLKVLEEELNELFEITKDFKKQNMEYHRKRLSDIFQKSEAEKAEAYRKLDFIRRQLIDLEATSAESNARSMYDCDSGFSSKSEHDQDAKILEALRRRLRKLNECGFEMKKRVQKLEIENSELSTSLSSERSFSERNSKTLKELADLLCGMTGKQFSYKDIYKSLCQRNPFCEAILELKKNYHQSEQQLQCNLEKHSRKIEELQQLLVDSQKEYSQVDQNCRPNDSLKNQIERLQCIIAEKEDAIAQLNAMLQRIKCEAQKHAEYCNAGAKSSNKMDYHELCVELEQANGKIRSLTCELERSKKQERFLHSETRKLNEELIDNKRRSGDVAMQASRLSALLNAQEALRTELSRKYEVIEQNYEEQSKKLRDACAQLSCLQDRLTMMDKRHEEHIMERNLLRDEVLALKEKEAHLLSKHRGISEQLMDTQKELFTAHDVMNEQKTILQRNDYAHAEIVKRLQETSNDLKRQLNSVCEDYKKLEQDCSDQIEVRKQNEQIIESFRNWKDEQLKSDDVTRASFRKYEEHIRLLLEEKQNFLEQYRDLHRDYCVLQHELDRIKTCSASMPRVNTTENSMSRRMELLRRASRRISQQSNCIRSENNSQEVMSSKTSQDAC